MMNHKRFLTTLAAAIMLVGCWSITTSSTAEAGCFGRQMRRANYGWGGQSSYRVGWRSYGYSNFGYSNFGYSGYSGYYRPYNGYGGCGCGYSYGGCGYGGYGNGYGGYGNGYGGYGNGYGGYGNGYGYSSNTVSSAGSVANAANSTNRLGATQSLATDWNINATTPVDSRSIELTISVPEDARVIINDRPTTTEGGERTYVVRGAQAGTSYTFVVRAEFDRDGRTSTETKEIVLRAGQSSALAFNIQPTIGPSVTADQLANTRLKLHVPENSKVFLAGTEMKQNAGLCVFETDRLQEGEKLKDYNVRVTFMSDGKEESIEKMVTLVGGQSQEIRFDADPSTRLASR
jgi:uncharacterized protein (TIGR03000 family)